MIHSPEGGKDGRESNSWFQVTWRKETGDDTWEITVTNSIYIYIFFRRDRSQIPARVQIRSFRATPCIGVDTISGSAEFPTSNRIAVERAVVLTIMATDSSRYAIYFSSGVGKFIKKHTLIRSRIRWGADRVNPRLLGPTGSRLLCQGNFIIFKFNFRGIGRFVAAGLNVFLNPGRGWIVTRMKFHFAAMCEEIKDSWISFD